MKKYQKIFIFLIAAIFFPIKVWANPVPMMPVGPFSAIHLPDIFAIYIFFGSIIEITIAFVFTLIVGLKEKGKILLSVLFSNLIFYPLFWFIILPMLSQPESRSTSTLPPSNVPDFSFQFIILAESIIVLVESILIYIFCNKIFKIQLSKKISFFLSLTVNFFSFLMPFFLMMLYGLSSSSSNF